jgi:hypothetical protein
MCFDFIVPEFSLSYFGNLLYYLLNFHGFLSQKYFGIFKNGQKKCPKLKKAERLSQKCNICDHN